MTNLLNEKMRPLFALEIHSKFEKASGSFDFMSCQVIWYNESNDEKLKNGGLRDLDCTNDDAQSKDDGYDDDDDYDRVKLSSPK